VKLHKELNGSPINTIEFHPDGGLFGSGQLDGSIKIWDLTSQQEILKLHDHGMESVSSISFSQNGFYLASCGEEDLTVRIWDIRKNKVVKTLNLEIDQNVNKVSFDSSGNYLTLSGYVVGILDVKAMTAVFDEKFGGKLGSHKNICTSAKFLHDYFISTSLDGEVNFNTI